MVIYSNNMTAICYITQKIMNMNNNVFSLKYDKRDPIKPLMKMLFISLVTNRHNGKFVMFKEQMNCFLHFSREEFIDYFCKIQKIYYAFSRLAFIYKYKKSTMSVTTDMGLNDIKMYDKNVLCIFHFNSRYLFNINDLLKIIYTSLTNSYMLFSQPLPSKNPYNNLPFTKSNLYDIYFFMKFNTHIYNDLFFKFFNCDFNLSTFYHKYEYLLRDYILENYVKNSSDDILIEEIKKMIHQYNKKAIKNKKILIHDEFPKKRFIKIMKPYLMLHLHSFYSLIPIIKNNTEILLNHKLKKFYKFNPRFGRKVFKLEFKYDASLKKRSYVKSYEFIDKHIPFNVDENVNFLTDHTHYDEIESVNHPNITIEETIIYYSTDVSEDEVSCEDESDESDDDESDDSDDEIPWGLAAAANNGEDENNNEEEEDDSVS